MEGIPGAKDIRGLSGRVMTTQSAELQFFANFNTPESAAPVKTQLDTMLGESKADALAIGIPQSVMDSIAIALDGSTLSLSLRVDADSATPLTLLIGSMLQAGE